MENSAYAFPASFSTCAPCAGAHAGEVLGEIPADTFPVLGQSPNPLADMCFQFAQMSDFSSRVVYVFLTSLSLS